MAYPELGKKVVLKMSEGLQEVGNLESEPVLMGRSLICVIAPGAAKVKKK